LRDSVAVVAAFTIVALPNIPHALQHVGPGIVTMLNTGRDSNNSQFAITLAKTDWLDGTCVVVGNVLEGLQYLHTVAEKYGSTSGLPKQEVYVTDCGELANYVLE
jgi:cyclophilin family peptidyl-prolyl cis-trans isomerase